MDTNDPTDTNRRRWKSKRVRCVLADRIKPDEQVARYMDWAFNAGLASITLFRENLSTPATHCTAHAAETANAYGLTIKRLTRKQAEDYA